MVCRKQSLKGHVEGHQHDRHAGLENDLGRMRIGIDVELRPGRAMAKRREGTAHRYDLANAARDIRMLDQRQCEIRERSDGANGDLLTRRYGGASRTHDKLDCTLFCRHDIARLDQLVIERTDASVFAINLFAHKRATCAGKNRHVKAAAHAHQLAGIRNGMFQRNIAGHDREAENLDFRRGKRHQDGGGIVHARIRIDDDLVAAHATAFSSA
ncbi:hypothetical protein D3C73_984110 [compost metagenome]